MRYTREERHELLEKNGWSKNDFRLVVKDCDELEEKLASRGSRILSAVPSEAEEFIKEGLENIASNDNQLISEIEIIQASVKYQRKNKPVAVGKAHEDGIRWAIKRCIAG